MITHLGGTRLALHDHVVPERVEHVLGPVEPEVADEDHGHHDEHTHERGRVEENGDLHV